MGQYLAVSGRTIAKYILLGVEVGGVGTPRFVGFLGGSLVGLWLVTWLDGRLVGWLVRCRLVGNFARSIAHALFTGRKSVGSLVGSMVLSHGETLV